MVKTFIVIGFLIAFSSAIMQIPYKDENEKFNAMTPITGHAFAEQLATFDQDDMHEAKLSCPTTKDILCNMSSKMYFCVSPTHLQGNGEKEEEVVLLLENTEMNVQCKVAKHKISSELYDILIDRDMVETPDNPHFCHAVADEKTMYYQLTDLNKKIDFDKINFANGVTITDENHYSFFYCGAKAEVERAFQEYQESQKKADHEDQTKYVDNHEAEKPQVQPPKEKDLFNFDGDTSKRQFMKKNYELNQKLKQKKKLKTGTGKNSDCIIYVIIFIIVGFIGIYTYFVCYANAVTLPPQKQTSSAAFFNGTYGSYQWKKVQNINDKDSTEEIDESTTISFFNPNDCIIDVKEQEQNSKS